MLNIIAEKLRVIDRALWQGWTVHSEATGEERYYSFPRLSLAVDLVASILEGERPWLFGARETEEADVPEKTELRLVA